MHQVRPCRAKASPTARFTTAFVPADIRRFILPASVYLSLRFPVEMNLKIFRSSQRASSFICVCISFNLPLCLISNSPTILMQCDTILITDLNWYKCIYFFWKYAIYYYRIYNGKTWIFIQYLNYYLYFFTSLNFAMQLTLCLFATGTTLINRVLN